MESCYESFKSMTPKQKNRHWKMLGEKLGVPGDTVRRKWNALVFTYKRRKVNGGVKKTGRGATSAGAWRHEDQLTRIIGDDPSVSPTAIRASLTLPEACPESSENVAPTDTPSSSLHPPPSTPTTPFQQPPSASPTTPTSSDSIPTSQSGKRKRRPDVAAEITAYLERKERREIEFMKEKNEREERRLKIEEQRIGLLRDLVNIRKSKSGECH